MILRFVSTFETTDKNIVRFFVTTFPNALDPFFLRPAPVAPPASCNVAHHHCLQVRPVLSLELNVSADILERLHQPCEVAFLEHLRRRDAFYQARLIGTQSFRFLWLQFGPPVVLVELHRPGPRRRGTCLVVHASTSPIAATRRACISAIPRASLFARSRPLR